LEGARLKMKRFHLETLQPPFERMGKAGKLLKTRRENQRETVATAIALKKY
jgi:hypothetical protein